MTVPCKYWRHIGLKGIGRCAIGMYDMPSYNKCLYHCGAYEGPPRGLGDLIHNGAKRIGLGGCGGCGQRAAGLNRLTSGLWVPSHVKEATDASA